MNWLICVLKINLAIEWDLQCSNIENNMYIKIRKALHINNFLKAPNNCFRS